jgi:SAM-dependent methyltransferase
MLVCPACSGALTPELICAACGWRGQYRDALPVLLPDPELNDQIARSYRDNYDQIAQDDLEEKVSHPRFRENLARNFCDQIDLAPGAEVCDIGAGQGVLARKLIERGAATVTAVDISLPYLVRLTGQAGISPVMANAETLPFVEHFDVVVTTDVLEHVLNIGSFLYCLNRALRSGGRLYVRVPYRENLLSYSPHFGCPYRFVHFRTFDRTMLRQALQEAGFAVERMWFDGYLTDIPRSMWSRGGVQRKLYRFFEEGLRRSGRDPADVTLQPHGLRQIFLQPTVVAAAARKIKRLVPFAEGWKKWPGFELKDLLKSNDVKPEA